MTRGIPPCATCAERIIRVDRPPIPRCSVYKDGIPTALLNRDRTCRHRNVQTSLEGDALTRFEANTGGVFMHRYYHRG